jgi:hypothetical protein
VSFGDGLGSIPDEKGLRRVACPEPDFAEFTISMRAIKNNQEYLISS